MSVSQGDLVWINIAVKVIKSNITYHQIEGKDSSIGYGVHVGPGDLIISNATASSVTHVTINIVQSTFDHTKSIFFDEGGSYYHYWAHHLFRCLFLHFDSVLRTMDQRFWSELHLGCNSRISMCSCASNNIVDICYCHHPMAFLRFESRWTLLRLHLLRQHGLIRMAL